ncbi:hypothetical protein [Streptomyces sp. Agncl-13]|uniref:hypothetical protein n=1 Tax=Streptomyces sp. Agncl-13 TaxID=3400628 RepID=UPI003A846180
MSLLGRAAEAGRLRVPVVQATRVIHAATTGATPALIGEESSERDLTTTSARLRDTVIASITTDPPASSGSDLASRALTLDAALQTALTTGPPAPKALRPSASRSQVPSAERRVPARPS